MSVEGKWQLTVNSPVGPQVSVLQLSYADGVLTGTQHVAGKTFEITDTRVEGNNVFWATAVTVPMKMKIEFSGTIDGDRVSGKAKTGMFGSHPFTGNKEA